MQSKIGNQEETQRVDPRGTTYCYRSLILRQVRGQIEKVPAIHPHLEGIMSL